jgi:endonuclease/exonuclease/phosphatase family metal-dependent hydrolase
MTHCRRLLATLLLIAAADTAGAFDPWAGTLAKSNPDYVRVLSYNVLNQFPAGTAAQSAAHERLLRAIQPDVISFQEMDPGIAPTVATRLGQILGGTWYTYGGRSDGVNINVLAARWPLSMQRQDTDPASATRGTTIARIDLPDARYPVDLYFMAVHFKCCSEPGDDERRQRHADAIAAWMGDARTPGGRITLPAGTPMMVVGDFNFNNSASTGPRTTILTGAISDTATFGPPIKPDWDGTDISEALPLNPYTMSANTFSSSTANPTSRLDRFYYTDSVATVAQGFVLNTQTVPTGLRTALGIQSGDTAVASDHLPVVVDFALGTVTLTEPQAGDVFVTEFQPDPTLVPDESGEWLELYNRTDAPIDLNGWVLRDSGDNLHVIRREGGVVIAPRAHLVLGLNGNRATNGDVPVDYVISGGFRLANGADTIELYRGSVKIDGVSYNGGAAGMVPPNTPAGTVSAGVARALQGNYFGGSTGEWDNAQRLYNARDRGTPGTWNETSAPPTPTIWAVK